MRLRIGLICRPGLLAVALVWACPNAEAAARYTLTDLGTSHVDDNPPGGIGVYSSPQVDDSGVVHFGVGRTDAGAYQFVTTNLGTAQYSESGSYPVNVTSPVSWGPGFSTAAGGINASGTAVGYITPDTGGLSAISTAYVYNLARSSPGLLVIPGAYPGTTAWYALGVNASGMIVGTTPPDEPLATHGNLLRDGVAFVSDGKSTVDLNTLIAPGSGVLLTSATSINDLGQIAGYASDANDDSVHAYLLTPTPEPGTLAVFALAAAGLGMRRWARRRAGSASR